MTLHLSIGAALAVLLATAGAAWAEEPVRCTTDVLKAETCRYPDGTTTRRSTDALGYETFRDRDGTVTRQKVDTSSNAVLVNGRGKVIERCHSDGNGHVICRRGK
jgi:hypothetical protein